MSKGRSLPPALKQLLQQPTFPTRASRVSASKQLPPGRSANPSPTPKLTSVGQHFQSLQAEAKQKGISWCEWISIATATLFTLNNPGSLQALHRFAAGDKSTDLEHRQNVALLMRETGLKCIGFIGIPKVINNLAALRKAVEEDLELVGSLPTQPRRQIKSDRLDAVHKAAYSLWDDIYTPHSDKLLKILGTSHPDLPVFIVESEYGPLFSSPASFALPSDPDSAKKEPVWDVNRLRTSLVAISALRAQGGVGPQVTSHVWGLLKAKDSIKPDDASKQGLEWLTTEEGALWVVRTVDGICEAIEGAEEFEGQGKESKL
ncbi:related to conserved mitochondrial protein [Ustilago sp. UG-2017b]|nr:related to conserved mitochondrial protein [Ustilago sp. UG-2017b]